MTSVRSAELSPLSALDVLAGRALAPLGHRPGVVRAGFAVSEGGGRQLLFTASDRTDGAGVHSWCHVDATSRVPLTRAVHDGELVAGSLDELAERFPTFVRDQRGTGVELVVAVPVTDGARHLGGLVVYVDASLDAPGLGDLHDELLELGRTVGADLTRARAELQRTTVASDDEQAAVGGSTDARLASHEMAADLPAVAGARRFLRGTLETWGIDADLVDDAVLCLAELVTNAIVHTHGGCRVWARLAGHVLRIEVVDRGSLGPVRIASAGEMAGHGRGLQLVAALASRTGRDAAACRAWFELDVPSTASTATPR